MDKNYNYFRLFWLGLLPHLRQASHTNKRSEEISNQAPLSEPVGMRWDQFFRVSVNFSYLQLLKTIPSQEYSLLLHLVKNWNIL